MFALLPYLWMAFIVAVVAFPTVSALTNRPKRRPKVVESGETMDPLATEPAALDFGDEIAQMEK